MKKTILWVVLVLFLTVIGVFALKIQSVREKSTTITVPDDHSTIQGAINAAISGDTIYVRAGVYHENVVVDKAVSLMGEYRENTLIDGKGTGTVIHMKANNAIISGFKVQNSGVKRDERGYVRRYYEGVYLDRSFNCSISGNNITNNGHGISLFWSSNNSISENYVAANLYNIVLESSKFNSISRNAMKDSGGISFKGSYEDHVVLGASSYNIISGNNVTNSRIQFARECSYNTITGNNIKGHIDHGIWIVQSTNNIISRNNITNNEYGIYLSGSNNTVSGNNIEANNRLGIRLEGSNNIIFENNIKGHNRSGVWGNGTGIHIWGSMSENNHIHHNNFVDNTQHVVNSYYHGEAKRPTSSWDNDYPNGGNYWSNYTGVDLCSGLYQNVTGSDGIGDTPYVIDGDNRDRYPLMSPVVGYGGTQLRHPFTHPKSQAASLVRLRLFRFDNSERSLVVTSEMIISFHHSNKGYLLGTEEPNDDMNYFLILTIT